MAGSRSAADDRIFALALVVVALLALALRAPVAGLPFERDEGEYAYIAQRWFEGDVPYRDAFDQKPPGIFVFYAAAFAAFGESEAAVRWTAQLWALVGIAAIAVLGARIATPAAGVAAAIAAVACAAQPGWLNNAVNTEQVAVTPLALGGVAALALATRSGIGPSFAVGALGSLALLLKPVTLPIVAYQIGTALWLGRRRRVAHAVAAALGLGIPLAATASWFAAHGAWRELVDALLWNNLDYASRVALSDYPTVFAMGVTPSLAALAPIYASVLAAPLALLRSLPSPVAVRPLLWVAGWLVVSLVAVSAGGYFRHHYFALALPPLAVLAGIGLDAFARWALASRRYARWAGAGLALALLGWTVVSDWWYFGPAPAGAKLQRLYGANAFPEAPQLGAWIAANSEPTDRFFVYGSEPQLFFYANRPSASRYIFVYPLTMPLPAAAERQREALADFDAARPLFVVATFAFGSILEQPGTPPELKTGLRERLGRDYDLTAVVPYFEDRSTQILLGDRARAIWEAQPLWDGATPWAAYVVWKRRD